jgi:hypothetical protein
MPVSPKVQGTGTEILRFAQNDRGEGVGSLREGWSC